MKGIFILNTVILMCLASLYGCSDDESGRREDKSIAHKPESKVVNQIEPSERAKDLLKEASEHYVAKDLDQAISSVDEAVKISNQMTYTRDINGTTADAVKLYAKFGDFDKVLSLENKHPDIILCRVCIVREAVEQNKIEMAIKVTHQLITPGSKSFGTDNWVEAHALIAGEYARTDQMDKANKILSQFSGAKDRAIILTEVIAGQSNIGKTQQAEILLDELNDLTRSLPDPSTILYINTSKYWIGKALIRQGDVDRAYEIINSMKMHISKQQVSSSKIDGLILVVEEKSKQGDFNEAVEILRTGVDSLHDELIGESKLYSGAVASLVTHQGNEYAEEIINDVKAIKDPMAKAYCLLSIAEAYPNNGDIAAVERLLDAAVNTALSINQDLSTDYAYFKPLILIKSSDLYFEKGLKEKAVNGLKLADETRKTEYQQKDYNEAYSKIIGAPEKQLAPYAPIGGSYGATKRHTPDSVAQEYGFKDSKDFKKWYNEQ